jgi:LysM repeat protein
MNMIDCASILNVTSCAKLVHNGITHVGRYLPTVSWKGLTASEVSAIRASGLNLVSIYEAGANKATYFSRDQGVSDANKANQLAKSIGQPGGTAIYFTVDFDAQTKDFANILNYFQGLKDTLQSYKIGCYGKFAIINLIKSKGLADYFWQTYAWSSGQHASGLHLMQYKNDVSQYGLGFNVDLDQVENGDCGGWTNTPSQHPPAQNTASFVMTVKVLNQTDIRDQPSHTSGYIKDALPNEIYNVIQVSNDWHQVAVNNQVKGWIDGNNGHNVLDLTKATPAKTKPYKIQSGQSLTKIANIFNTTLQNLLALNPNITNPNKIYAGQIILVPIN